MFYQIANVERTKGVGWKTKGNAGILSVNYKIYATSLVNS